MKTMEALFDEIMQSKELQAEFMKEREEFLKKHDCQATMEEVIAFLKEKVDDTKELSADEMTQVAGGTFKPSLPDCIVSGSAPIDTNYCQAGVSPDIIKSLCGSTGI